MKQILPAHGSIALQVVRAVNLLVAFSLELVMLGALGFWGFQRFAGSWLQYAVALGAVALAIALWAVWAARNARRRLRQPWLAALQLSLFGAAAAAWHDAGQTTAAAVLAVVAVVNVLGGIALKQD